MSDNEKTDIDHIERARSNTPSEAVLKDHRADDDRADVARGRNSDKYEKRYWLSVNYIGTLFAIGIAFMGGIGGMNHLVFQECLNVNRSFRLWSHRTSAERHQRGNWTFTKHQLGSTRQYRLWCSFLPYGRPAVRYFRKTMVSQIHAQLTSISMTNIV